MLAIDGLLHDSGKASGFFHSGSGSQSEWFQIDMGRKETVNQVQLFFRTDAEVAHFKDRRQNIQVRVGNIQASEALAGNPLCATLVSLPDSVNADLTCKAPLTGRYIVIRQAGNEFWDLDEVSAFSPVTK